MSAKESQRTKIAFVCQRYGAEVNGGAELHCRLMAEKLTAMYDVTVYTTCAIDYQTWRNEYSPGTDMIHGVHVRRYPVAKERDMARFSEMCHIMFSRNTVTEAQEEEWVEAQGPYCPALLETLWHERNQYRIIFFMTYLYYLTAKGLRMGFENAFLIPTAHDEAPIYLPVYQKVFGGARGIVWNTEAERDFTCSLFPFLKDKPMDVTGLGFDDPPETLVPLPPALQDGKYLVYAGRIDQNKGCDILFEYFIRYMREHPESELRLALMGKPVIPVPDDPRIIYLGYVSDKMKYSVMRHCLALALFSQYESLSMIVLENMYMGKPVIVNGRSEVLKEHCVRSNAGMYFQNYYEFSSILDYLLSHPAEYEKMCKNGRQYVIQNYSWQVILKKYQGLIEAFRPWEDQEVKASGNE